MISKVSSWHNTANEFGPGWLLKRKMGISSFPVAHLSSSQHLALPSPSFCLSLDSFLTRFHTDPVRLAIRVTGIFFPFELCSRMKNMCQLCRCSCLYLLLPLLAHGQLRWAPSACRHLMQMGSRVQQPKLWLPTRGLLKNKSILWSTTITLICLSAI